MNYFKGCQLKGQIYKNMGQQVFTVETYPKGLLQNNIICRGFRLINPSVNIKTTIAMMPDKRPSFEKAPES
jgi:hypothetical protein